MLKNRYPMQDIFIRAARELLRWDQSQLAKVMKRDVRTVRRLEEGERVADETWRRAFSALEGAGIRFTAPRETRDGRIIGGVALYERNLMAPRKSYKPRRLARD